MEPSSKKQKTEENDKAHMSVEDTCKILEAFTREQLMQVVQEAATKHPNVLDLVRSKADQNPAHRKLFVRGLHWETNTESLKAIFSQYGELEEGAVIMDKSTGKSKGYGFVTFKHIDSALKALQEPSKEIDGRMTVANFASAGSHRSQPRSELFHMRNGMNHRGSRHPNPSGIHPSGHLNNQQVLNSSTFSSTGAMLHGPQSGIGGYGGLGTYGVPQVWGYAGTEARGGDGPTYGVQPTSGVGPHGQPRG